MKFKLFPMFVLLGLVLSSCGGNVAATQPPATSPSVATEPATGGGGGTVVLEGPNGIRTAVAGDTVPGVGRIDSIVRWGNRWIVATANGLIATP